MTQAVEESGVLQKLVEQASSLYSLPAVAIDVLKLTEQPKVDFRALKECIEHDPALTCKLLRVVNSSVFGLSREVSDLNQALTLLGVKPLKLLVLGFSLPKSLFASVEAETLRRYWRFTLIKAVASRELSRLFWPSSEDEAFIAGLLQEIGSLVLIQELGSSYSEFLEAANRQGKNLTELEVDTLGFDHTILSARLLDHWKLPTSIVDAIARPHDMDKLAVLTGELCALPQILHLASLIAAIIVDDRHDRTAELFAAGERYRGITAEQFNELLDEVQQRIDVLADLFSVQMNEEDRYRDILIRAHRQLSEATVDLVPTVIASGDSDRLVQQQRILELAAAQFRREPSTPNRLSEKSPTVHIAAGTCQAKHATQVGDRVTGTQNQQFLGRVTAAVGQGRIMHCDVSFMLLEVNDYDRLLVQNGPEGASRLVDSLQDGIYHFCGPDVECLLVTDSRCAVILLDCECRQAVGYARQLVDRLPVWLIEKGCSDTVLELRAGVAAVGYPSRHFGSEQVIESAERCLFAAQSSGSQSVKSIDLA